MKQSACGDVVPGCDATLVCSPEEEIMALVPSPAAADHGRTEIPTELVDRVVGHIPRVG